MNTTEPPARRRLVFLSVLVFLGVLALMVVFQATLRETVLVPLLYLFWVGSLILRSFDQDCIWVAVLFSAIALSLAFPRRAKPPVEAAPLATRRAEAAGRIHFWQNQMRLMRSAIYAQPAVHRLVAEALAYREHASADQIMKQLRAGQVEVPAEVRAVLYLDARERRVRPARLGELIRQWVGRRSRADGAASLPDPALESVANYLENLLEVESDNGNR